MDPPVAVDTKPPKRGLVAVHAVLGSKSKSRSRFGTATATATATVSQFSARGRGHTKTMMVLIAFFLFGVNQYFQASKIVSSTSEIPTPTVTNNSNSNSNSNSRAVYEDSSQHEDEDTAIIITSAWIPSHPSTYMIEMVINSTKLLAGLSPTAPIFITIDQFRLDGFNNLPSTEQGERLQSLEQYTINLYNMFLHNPHVHIIPSMKHLHVGGSMVKAMNLIERNFPTVRYLYQMQHDYYFQKEVNHTAMISLMKKNPEKLNYILFRNTKGLMRNIKPCGQEVITVGNQNQTNNEMQPQPTSSPMLIPTATYSDNNHLVQFQWYKDTIESIISLARFPENPLQKRAYDGCARKSGGMGLYVYSEAGMIVHLNGRKIQA